jgi:hypothetical protein
MGDKLLGIFLVMISILGIGGWVNNIVELAGMDGFSGMLVLRVAGIFIAPLGAILGFV